MFLNIPTNTDSLLELRDIITCHCKQLQLTIGDAGAMEVKRSKTTGIRKRLLVVRFTSFNKVAAH